MERFHEMREKEGRYVFSEWLKEHDLKKCLKPLGEYRPCPKAGDRAFWDHIPADIRTMALTYAEKYLGYEYPIVRASDFMNFYRKGDREANTRQHINRRQALRRLVIGECVEHKGRFMDDIIDANERILLQLDKLAAELALVGLEENEAQSNEMLVEIQTLVDQAKFYQ